MMDCNEECGGLKYECVIDEVFPFPSSFAYRFYLNQKKTLEINPRHPLIKELLKRVDDDASDQSTMDLAQVLYDTAVLR